MTNACIAIGIERTAGQGLAKLPGAVNGARAMAAWARAAGYATELVTDRGDDDGFTPVDATRVRDALMRLLPMADDGVDRGGPADPPERLIVYFAGHGMQSAADGELWLLSDSYNDQIAIGIARLQALLQGYVTGVVPGQIAIISDACRSPMIAQWNVNMAPVGVIPRGPYDPNNFDQVDIDQYLAVPPLSSAFMIRATEDGPARCIFTSVLLEALHGTGEDCFDAQGDITSDTLAAYLKKNVYPRAIQYGVEMRPRVYPCFIAPKDVYLSRNALGQMALPSLDPWPGEGAARRRGGDSGPGYKSMGAADDDVRDDDYPRRRPGYLPPDNNAPAPKAEPALNTDERSQISAEVLAASVVQSALAGRADELLGAAANGHVATHYETNAGVSVIGPGIMAVACAPAFNVEPDVKFPASRRIVGPHYVLAPNQSTWVLLDLEGGRSVATTAASGFITTCIVGEEGCSVASLRPLWLEMTVRLKSELLLMRSEFASSGPDEALDWLADLSTQQAFDPMLGVLAAYVFYAAGQQDNVRRVAAVFANRGVTLPFDIALLARAHGRIEPDGTLVATMGPTRPRIARTSAERQREALLIGLDGFDAPVAGRFPLLRQGWFLLERGRDQLVIPDLAELAGRLASAAFATFDTDTAAALKQLLETYP